MHRFLLALISLAASATFAQPAADAAAPAGNATWLITSPADSSSSRRVLIKYLTKHKALLPPFGHFPKPTPKPASVFKAQAKALCLDKRVPPSTGEGVNTTQWRTNWDLSIIPNEGGSTKFLGFNGAEYAKLTFVPYVWFNPKYRDDPVRKALAHSTLKKLPHVKQYLRIELYDTFFVIVQEPVSLCNMYSLTIDNDYKLVALPEAKAKAIMKDLLRGVAEIRSAGLKHTIKEIYDLDLVVNAKGQTTAKISELPCDSKADNLCFNRAPVARSPRKEQEYVLVLGTILYRMLSATDEVLAGHYNKRTGVWVPNVPHKVNYSSPHFKKVSKEGMQLLKGMVEPDARKRWTLKQVLSSKWVQ